MTNSRNKGAPWITSALSAVARRLSAIVAPARYLRSPRGAISGYAGTISPTQKPDARLPLLYARREALIARIEKARRQRKATSSAERELRAVVCDILRAEMQ